mgnify:CR=1 FL=1
MPFFRDQPVHSNGERLVMVVIQGVEVYVVRNFLRRVQVGVCGSLVSIFSSYPGGALRVQEAS